MRVVANRLPALRVESHYAEPSYALFETLGGFLLDEFGRIPEVGDQIGHDDWEFKVKEMDGHRIAEVLVVRPPDEGREA